jgi:hypothetical protein
MARQALEVTMASNPIEIIDRKILFSMSFLLLFFALFALSIDSETIAERTSPDVRAQITLNRRVFQ